MNFAEFLTSGGPVLTVHLLAIDVVAVIASFLGRRSWLRAAALGALVMSCLVQLATMAGTLLILGEAGLERGFYLFLLSWGMLLTGIAFWLRKGLAALSLIVMPVALLICLISLAYHTCKFFGHVHSDACGSSAGQLLPYWDRLWGRSGLSRAGKAYQKQGKAVTVT